MITFNFREESIAKHPWIEDARVRKAIEYAIDKEGIKNTVFDGWAYPAYGFVCDFLPAWYNPNIELTYYDKAEAERLLDEAGYTRGSDGVRFEMDMVCYSSYADWAEVIKEYLRDVGISVELKLVESTTFFQLYERGEEGLQDIACGLNNQGVGANVGETRRSWIYGGTGEAPRGSMNMGFYANERVDELFDIMQNTLDYEAQKAAIWEIQEILQEEKPYIFMFNAMTKLAYNDDFHLEQIRECYDESYYDVWWEGGTAGPGGETVTQTVTQTMTQTTTQTTTETVGGGETITKTETETVTTGVSTMMAGGLAVVGIIVGAIAGMFLFKKS
jgi:ABC-type transport system substrate-binding protein